MDMSSPNPSSVGSKANGHVVSAHDQIVRALAQDILTGALAPGDKLPAEADLLERFGVSRTALREALKTLSAKGFLSVKTRVGTRVTDSVHWNFFDKEVLAWRVAIGMDAQFRRHLAEVRRSLEPTAAALAAKHRTEADLQTMRAALEWMRRESASAHEFARADLALHLAIGAASQNPMIRSVAGVIETALLEAFVLSPPTQAPDLHLETVEAHARIVDRIAARDEIGAAQAMLAVIDAGYQRVETEQSPSAT
ncbi:FadR/GntR family transcriptional regulator [Brevundimonas sp.]|uniref:FadR/GntR family transcriptional regulator n=1 Tax=Brevundimonas sp. TaxID=1871086 RepID=UPI003D6C739F